MNVAQRPSSTSLYTTFVVVLERLPSSSQTTTFNPRLLFTLERATYSCPCVNTGRGKYKPTLESDCPWLLLIVMAKETDIGYCFLTILRGKRLSDEVILKILD